MQIPLAQLEEYLELQLVPLPPKDAAANSSGTAGSVGRATFTTSSAYAPIRVAPAAAADDQRPGGRAGRMVAASLSEAVLPPSRDPFSGLGRLDSAVSKHMSSVGHTRNTEQPIRRVLSRGPNARASSSTAAASPADASSSMTRTGSSTAFRRPGEHGLKLHGQLPRPTERTRRSPPLPSMPVLSQDDSESETETESDHERDILLRGVNYLKHGNKRVRVEDRHQRDSVSEDVYGFPTHRVADCTGHAHDGTHKRDREDNESESVRTGSFPARVDGLARGLRLTKDLLHVRRGTLQLSTRGRGAIERITTKRSMSPAIPARRPARPLGDQLQRESPKADRARLPTPARPAAAAPQPVEDELVQTLQAMGYTTCSIERAMLVAGRRDDINAILDYLMSEAAIVAAQAGRFLCPARVRRGY